MKKILASAGLVALSAVSSQAASAPALTPQQTSKPWTVSASLRGFYDDNYATAPNGPLRRDSFGFEVSPTAGLNYLQDATQIMASNRFGLRWYEDRINNEFDYTHQFNLSLHHKFNERYSVSVYDDFVSAQEPSLLNPAQNVQVLRINGNNIRNVAGLDFRADVTESIAVEPGYSFTFYDYKNKGPQSYSATLDRNEHLAKLGLRWVKMLERTDGILGYNFQAVDHTSNDSLAPALLPYIDPSIRDTRSHFYFVGVDHSFTDTLTANVRVGAQTVDYESSSKTRTSPYADVSGTYRFQERSTLQLGYKLSRLTSDMIGYFGTSDVVVDQLTHYVYSRVSHSISDLTLSGGLAYQYGTFRGGSVNSQSEGFLTMDLSASYQINPFLSAETGYVFDMLKDYGWAAGAAQRDYHRNYVYIGLKASY